MTTATPGETKDETMTLGEVLRTALRDEYGQAAVADLGEMGSLLRIESRLLAWHREQTDHKTSQRDALLTHLATTYRSPGGTEKMGDDCQSVGFSGAGRCIEPSVALAWEDGSATLACLTHARHAQRRGALVITASAERQAGAADV